MSFQSLYCAAFDGLSAKEVEVEVSFTKALPSFQVTGLAGNAIQESKQRVQSALMANDFKFPPLKITINLSPSDLPKQGSFYDLPIALLVAMYGRNNIKDSINNEKPKKYFAFGELGLDGRIKDTKAIYPLIFSLLSDEKNLDSIFFLPMESKDFYCQIPNLKAYFVDTLSEAIEILQTSPTIVNIIQELPFSYMDICSERYYYSDNFELDFIDIVGQIRAKRAALIAACGFHNILFEGSAGSGKSMIATRMPYILPPLRRNEILHNASHNLIITPNRPFRNPHNSATKAAILGSAVGHSVKFGEISLAHNGVLFFDELPHFPKSILESLREPLENHYFVISRLCTKVKTPSDFMFIGAMNPCPCGNLLSISKECRCSKREIDSYRGKISEPIWDRIDLCVQMQEGDSNKDRISSKEIQKQILDAFKFQKNRGQKCYNSRLIGESLEEFCKLDDECIFVLDKAIARFGISLRQKNKILKVARTIADLAGSDNIHKEHLAESISYRKIS
ncbi:YifB family Mg chelatase-like AAA ATPase [Helicobacter sp. WB40]|uniref:YifB family Mg chelatase-like AAA ATPase n=1 Tax=Helicobacter sp. WB40 TaxID=3004130 RepID=UPI0022EBBF79|nr:YifB family Mg chelatase-like AAA ATPase [Helicobacter sp. WB40]MDA3967652.1 YifB family Mg chelatase-like AAA ATPase [Helicobacter sp. WB40]